MRRLVVVLASALVSSIIFSGAAAAAPTERVTVNRATIAFQSGTPASVIKAVRVGMRELTTRQPVEAASYTVVVGRTVAWLADQVTAAEPGLHANEVRGFRKVRASGLMTNDGDWVYSLRGPDTQLVLVHPARGSDTSRVTLDVLAEAAEGLVGWWGGRSPGWPCWAAEGLGKPAAYAAWGSAFDRNGRAALRAWIATLRNPTVDMFTAAEEFAPACLYDGTGHRLGAGLSSLLTDRFGPTAVAEFVKATPGPDWRGVFAQRFGMSVEQAYALTVKEWPRR